MRWGVKYLLSEQEFELILVAGASGFPALDVWLMPRLGSIGEAGFEKITLFCLEAQGVTHSPVFFVGILIGCEVHKYRCRIVDAVVNRVLPREVAQAVMVPKTLVSRSWVRM